MPKSFTVKGKTYIVKHMLKPLYLDQFGYMSPYGDLTQKFDTMKQARKEYRISRTAAPCYIIDEAERDNYE